MTITKAGAALPTDCHMRDGAPYSYCQQCGWSGPVAYAAAPTGVDRSHAALRKVLAELSAIYCRDRVYSPLCDQATALLAIPEPQATPTDARHLRLEMAVREYLSIWGVDRRAAQAMRDAL